jgi:hypothetical protein
LVSLLGAEREKLLLFLLLLFSQSGTALRAGHRPAEEGGGGRARGPQGEIIILRRYLRHRETLVQEAATCIQRIQKALTEMNLQLANVVSDISGTTGLRILLAIVEGERDPHRLAAMRDWRIKPTPDEVAKSLLGNWRDEMIFVVGENLALFEEHQQKVERCDLECPIFCAVGLGIITQFYPFSTGSKRAGHSNFA